MNYTISIEDMKECRYPNLVAEFVESHCSLCTISEYMGHGRCSEDKKFIWEKLMGDIELMLDEANGLMQLFGAKADYLFDEELKMYGGKPIAYYRYYEANRRLEEGMRIHQIAEDIRHGLKEKPYLAEFMKSILSWTEEQVKQTETMIHQIKVA